MLYTISSIIFKTDWNKRSCFKPKVVIKIYFQPELKHAYYYRTVNHFKLCQKIKNVKDRL